MVFKINPLSAKKSSKVKVTSCSTHLAFAVPYHLWFRFQTCRNVFYEFISINLALKRLN